MHWLSIKRVIAILSGIVIFQQTSLQGFDFMGINFEDRFKELSWVEQVHCGTSCVKGVIDIMHTSSHRGVSPLLFWLITLSDDLLNVYISWAIKSDRDLYAVSWLLRNIFFAVKDAVDQHAAEGSELYDRDLDMDHEQISEAKDTFTTLSPILKSFFAIMVVMKNKQEDAYGRRVYQAIKSFIRCGRWYAKGSQLHPKNRITKVSLALTMLNGISLLRDVARSHESAH